MYASVKRVMFLGVPHIAGNILLAEGFSFSEDGYSLDVITKSYGIDEALTPIAKLVVLSNLR
jgi:hypothetical protein